MMAELLAAVGIITQINANRVWQMLESATTENLLEVLWQETDCIQHEKKKGY